MKVVCLLCHLKQVHAVVEADLEREVQRIRDSEGPEADNLADEVAADINRVDCNIASSSWRGLVFSRVQVRGQRCRAVAVGIV